MFDRRLLTQLARSTAQNPWESLRRGGAGAMLGSNLAMTDVGRVRRGACRKR